MFNHFAYACILMGPIKVYPSLYYPYPCQPGFTFMFGSSCLVALPGLWWFNEQQ
jgi:hypothetical protein